jgi:hypothetical protein
MHLDSGYDGKPSRVVLVQHDLVGEIATKGIPSPIQAGKRWVVEGTHSWMNNFGKLRRCTDRDGVIVDFYLYLAAAFVTLRCLIQKARQTSKIHNTDAVHAASNRQTPRRQGIRHRCPTQHAAHRPEGNRVLQETRPVPVGDRTHHHLAVRPPPPHHPRRTPRPLTC